MTQPPTHISGPPSLLPTTTIATFPIGSFLENIAVRPAPTGGHLLISDMSHGRIQTLDPNASDPQATLRTVHTFEGLNAAAIVEDPSRGDVFYTMAGRHTVVGSYAVYRLDFSSTIKKGGSEEVVVAVEKVADVPDAAWLNGATILPGHNRMLMVDSVQGRIYSLDLRTFEVGRWMLGREEEEEEQELLTGLPGIEVVAGSPPWPGVNGAQHFRGRLFLTNSARGLFLRAGVDARTGGYVEGSLTVLAENCAGDDLAFDAEGNAYVTTNPNQTVVRFVGAGSEGVERVEERATVMGGADVAETAGPTSAAFGRTEGDRKSLYVTTTGGLVRPVGEGPGVARVIRVDVGIRGQEV